MTTRRPPIVDIGVLRERARQRLPKPVFDFVDGGAEGESTMRANSDAFDRLLLMPRIYEGASEPDLGVTVLGQTLAFPVLTAPTGFTGVVHPDGERAAVRAAGAHGTAAIVSSSASYSIEELTSCGATRPPWFQLYPSVDRGVSMNLIERARSAGCPVLVVTIDVPAVGLRARDVINGMTLPPTVTRRNVASLTIRPRWLVRQALTPRLVAGNFVPPGTRPSYRSMVGSLSKSLDRTLQIVSWTDLEWIRSVWSGPLVVKGVLNPSDARQAAALGADGVVVSNHGGRQLDGVPATVEALPQVREAAGDSVDVLLDGGVRRGSDVIRARALGASACLIGRPYVFGLAVGGERGVTDVLEYFRVGIQRSMVLLGLSDLASVSSDVLASLTTSPRSVPDR